MTGARESFQETVEALLSLLDDQDVRDASWLVESVTTEGAYWRFAGLCREGYWLLFSGLRGSLTRDPAFAVEDLTRELLRFSLNRHLQSYVGPHTGAPFIQAEVAPNLQLPDALLVWIEVDDWVDLDRRAYLRTRLAYTGSDLDLEALHASPSVTGAMGDSRTWCRNRRFIEGTLQTGLMKKCLFPM